MAKFPVNYIPEKDLTAGVNLIEPGVADFTLKQVFDTNKDGGPLVSTKGDPMIKVVIEATDKNGSKTSIFEYYTPNTTFKAYTLCKALGRKELYTESGIDFDLLKGLSGKCRIKTESSPGYNDRSAVSSYIEHPKYDKKAQQEGVAPAMDPFEDETIPF